MEMKTTSVNFSCSVYSLENSNIKSKYSCYYGYSSDLMGPLKGSQGPSGTPKPPLENSWFRAAFLVKAELPAEGRAGGSTEARASGGTRSGPGGLPHHEAGGVNRRQAGGGNQITEGRGLRGSNKEFGHR